MFAAPCLIVSMVLSADLILCLVDDGNMSFHLSHTNYIWIRRSTTCSSRMRAVCSRVVSRIAIAFRAFCAKRAASSWQTINEDYFSVGGIGQFVTINDSRIQLPFLVGSRYWWEKYLHLHFIYIYIYILKQIIVKILSKLLYLKHGNIDSPILAGNLQRNCKLIILFQLYDQIQLVLFQQRNAQAQVIA